MTHPMIEKCARAALIADSEEGWTDDPDERMRWSDGRLAKPKEYTDIVIAVLRALRNDADMGLFGTLSLGAVLDSLLTEEGQP